MSHEEPVDENAEPAVDFKDIMTLARLRLTPEQEDALRGGYRHMNVMQRRTLGDPALKTGDTDVLCRLRRRTA